MSTEWRSESLNSDPLYRRPKRKRRGRRIAIIVALFILFAAAGGGALLGWSWIEDHLLASNEQVKPDHQSEYPIFVRGIEAESGAIVRNERVKLPVPVLETVLGPDRPVLYEKESGWIVLTAIEKVMKFKTESLTATLNEQPYNLTIEAEVQEEVVYIPADPLEELYGLHVEWDKDSNIITLLVAGDAISRGKIVQSGKPASLRKEASIYAPYYKQLSKDELVRIWEEKDGWYLIQASDGQAGYVRKSSLELLDIEQVPVPLQETFVSDWKEMGRRVNLTWEAVYNVAPNPEAIGPMPGVNVVSPTWFSLAENDGTVVGKADPAYVKWAHNRGYQVWALFNNDFDPDKTSAALSTVESRFRTIQQLLAFSELYDLQGINIDYENVRTADKENLVQFVRELTPLMHEQGLVVSIDVTAKSGSEMWSAFLDREALGRVVDYMILMAYDEHWAASPVAGSVASLPWTEASITRILEEDGVPPEKFVLGMPLYTRIWSETKGEDGKVSVSSKAIGMEGVKKLIAERELKPVFDEAVGQNYVEYQEEGVRKRIWIEDEVSMRLRGELVRKYDLAGVATWQRVFQTESIWSVIDEAVHKLP